MAGSDIFTMPFSKVYPLLVQKAERKGRTKDEVDEVICWLTGYDAVSLQSQLDKGVDMTTFYGEAPQMNPCRDMIKGVVCGIFDTIFEPTYQGGFYDTEKKLDAYPCSSARLCIVDRTGCM